MIMYLMFWFLYLFFTLNLCFLVSRIYAGQTRNYIFLSFLTIFLTPWFLEPGESTLSPAIVIFFYDILLEGNISFRPIKPILVALTFITILFLSLNFLKKRFSINN